MSAGGTRSAVLDGVRGLSIATVLVAHWLPLNALRPRLNESVGMLGMALFFVLSGYFIGRQVLVHVHPLEFVAKRLLRILPLAWLVAVVVAAIWHFEPSTLAAHLLFYANLSDAGMRVPLDHYWSLCVELQFYALATALLVFRPGVARVLVPALLVAVTGYRVYMSGYSGSITWYRIDDILAGFVLAILLHSPSRREAIGFFERPVVLWGAAALLCLACYNVDGNVASFLRPYAVLCLTGALLCQPRSAAAAFLSRPFWTYLATVSFAVYVLHVPLEHTWLGSGDVTEKYLKRPLLLAAVFLLAHLSTFYFERHFIAMGHRLRMSNDAVRSV
ncbi:acyltransferase [Mitsuaria sp. TWR114]|uniref:acyltransferase family protein n=1 Tax=Mitsuaria sp. TWR114 TaxID=2601731 RepID=UPI0011BD731E|nr:acyltransferase [Mitsuaria sp. TWR114]TXD80328.1 acyltransferase [Mitsuaria sp. TWR114]